MTVAIGCLLLGGCATQINSPGQSVLFSSDPPDASVIIDGRVHLNTSGMVRLSRQSSHTAVFQKPGFETQTIEIARRPSLWALMDVSCLLWIYYCLQDDLRYGGFYTFNDHIHVTLNPVTLNPHPQN
ncbi:MAG: hypothetical protein ACREI3_02990 [Nitrospirales bacterium]